MKQANPGNYIKLSGQYYKVDSSDNQLNLYCFRVHKVGGKFSFYTEDNSLVRINYGSAYEVVA